ncbi:hypothetical protein ACJIZ3_018584 [Penstemon smallii]|uniref:Uncharacterized protein n=1 Tax=Penstemon smallii TaxID=265156 RepID=A0ABD3SYU3_9LAMI
MKESTQSGHQLSSHEFDSSTLNSRSSSSIQIDPTTEFSTFINKLNPLLNEMKDSIQITELSAVQEAIESLETDYKRAKEAIESQNIQSSPAKYIEYLAQNLGRSLGLVLFTSQDVPVSNKQKIEALCREMMNVKFDVSSDHESEFEIVEEDASVLNIDDVIMQIRYGNEEELKNTLSQLSTLITNSGISIIDEDVIKISCSRLCSSKGNERVIILQILRYLIAQNHHFKERMKDLEFLSALVKSMTRDMDERREAVGLLLNLCDDPGVRRRIGRIQGCILMLVSISNGVDEEASRDAKEVLNSLSSNTQHALHMAEAGYFKPLIMYLNEGSDMSKVLMATALSRMELTDQHKASLGENGAIEPLVKMFNKGNLEAKLSSLNALQNLSNSKQNTQHIINSGIVVPLLQLLFSVTSVLMTLREPASAILAKVAESENILAKHDIAQQMLSLLNLSSPVIQHHLLEALNNITSHPSSSKVRKKMKENGAVQLLLPFFYETDSNIRISALNLVYKLSKDIQQDLIYTHLNVISSIILSSNSDSEKASALGILSNLPISDGKITDILKNANLMHAVVSNSTPIRECLAESIAGVMIRFTVPTDKRLQHYSVENGIFPILLELLSSSSEIAKSRAALCLTQLSQSSLHLSKSRKLKWFCIPPSMVDFCEIHDGHCSVKSTFCIVKAGAITPLIQILEGGERGADEAVLDCISTLLVDEIWERGCNYIAKNSGVHAVIKVLELGSLKSKKKAIWILERIFRVEAHREEYCESAQVVLIDLAQNGDPMLKPIVAKLLAQLELLQVQSSYF